MAVTKKKMQDQNELHEEGAIYDFLKTIKRYCPNLFKMFRDCKVDQRDQRYITYYVGTILIMLFFKYAFSIISMHGMTREFGYSKVIQNILQLSGQKNLNELPHYQTVNDFLAEFTPVFLENIRYKIIYGIIRSNQFYQYRLNKKYWVVIVDATQLYGGKRQINDRCIRHRHKKGTEEENSTYHTIVLEAKLLLCGTNVALSILSEFVENTPEENEQCKPTSNEQFKQDCELKAFKRMAKNLKKKFPRLPICIVADALYNCGSVMDICRENIWEYIFRFKDGTIRSISEEVEALKASAEKVGTDPLTPLDRVEFINEIDFGGRKVNYLRAANKEVEQKKSKKETRGRKKTKKNDVNPVTFQWITSLSLTKKLAIKVALTGRARWKIENEGFNRQKHWSGNITHLCSWDEKAIKNHYLMMQIVEIFRQLYEMLTYTANGISRTFGLMLY